MKYDLYNPFDCEKVMNCVYIGLSFKLLYCQPTCRGENICMTLRPCHMSTSMITVYLTPFCEGNRHRQTLAMTNKHTTQNESVAWSFQRFKMKFKNFKDF